MIFRTTFFTQTGLIEALYPFVACRIASTADALRPSGIPPHCAILGLIHQLNESVSDLNPALSSLGDSVVERITVQIENNSAASGGISLDGLGGVISRAVGPQIDSIREQVSALETFRANIRPLAIEPISVVVPNGNATNGFFWEGAFHRVPENFNLPSVGVHLAWQLWCCGDLGRGIPPYRELEFRDMPTTNLRKRLSDFRKLMSSMEAFAVRNNFWPDSIDARGASGIFQRAFDSLHLGGNIRIAQLKWITVLKRIRLTNRQTDESRDEEHNDNDHIINSLDDAESN